MMLDNYLINTLNSLQASILIVVIHNVLQGIMQDSYSARDICKVLFLVMWLTVTAVPEQNKDDREWVDFWPSGSDFIC